MNLPRLSPAAERLLSNASDDSHDQGHHYLGVEHLFLQLADDMKERIGPSFAAQKVDLADFLNELRRRIVSLELSWSGDDVLITPRCRQVLQIASRIAERRGVHDVSPDHILEAILREGRSLPMQLLKATGVDITELQEALVEPPARKSAETSTPLLDQFGRDLTVLAREGRLPPLIGRERELELLMQVLLRRNKNNPVLVGEAGVGKTAVVEGFAQLLVRDSCPKPLEGRRIVEITTSVLVAGTKFRGEFEERLLGICRELETHPEIVLFIDEIHTLMGAGSAGGDPLDAANIIKPGLSRGTIRCIGATTVEEYRRHIEKDPALERRFEKIPVEEPTPEEAVQILHGVRPLLEIHHQLSIVPDAVEAAVRLSIRHVPDRRLPDKALDALDQSCARKRLQRVMAQGRRGVREGTGKISADDVAATISQWTGMPLERICGEAAKNLLSLGEELRARVLGQDYAVRVVTRAILTAKAGLSSSHQPIGVFLFLGPTGVGKTELARSLATVLFGDERRLIRFDMSEYTEAHSVAKLIGAPPGYVGFEREGLLISAVRSHPHSVVLFDEVEKAHAEVFDLFLQMFDEGRLSGAHGKSADFTKAVIILTSNVKIEPPKRSVGFRTEDGAEVSVPVDPRQGLVGTFRPELLNRIHEVVLFNHLDSKALRGVIDRQLREIEQLLAERKVKVELDENVYDHLLQLGDTDQFGARELKRVVDRTIRQPLAEELLAHPPTAGTIRITLQKDGLQFQARAHEVGA